MQNNTSRNLTPLKQGYVMPTKGGCSSATSSSSVVVSDNYTAHCE